MMDAGLEELDLQGDEETKKLRTVKMIRPLEPLFPSARLLQLRPPCSKAEPLL
ncbi:unnamed protein product [Ectocarpus sp. 8 AP-2014]